MQQSQTTLNILAEEEDQSFDAFFNLFLSTLLFYSCKFAHITNYMNNQSIKKPLLFHVQICFSI